MGDIASRFAVSPGDDFGAGASFEFGSTIDKLDVTPLNGDVVLQFLTRQGSWLPAGGMMLRAGVFRSLPGISELFAEQGGAYGLRFKRAAAGVAASIDFEAFLQ